jgi:hypothetical protein
MHSQTLASFTFNYGGMASLSASFSHFSLLISISGSLFPSLARLFALSFLSLSISFPRALFRSLSLAPRHNFSVSLFTTKKVKLQSRTVFLLLPLKPRIGVSGPAVIKQQL